MYLNATISAVQCYRGPDVYDAEVAVRSFDEVVRGNWVIAKGLSYVEAIKRSEAAAKQLADSLNAAALVFLAPFKHAKE